MNKQNFLLLFFCLFANNCFALYQKESKDRMHYLLEADYVAFWRNDLDHMRILYSDYKHSSIFNKPIHTHMQFHNASGIKAIAQITPFPSMTFEALYLGLIQWKKNKTLYLGAPFGVPTKPYVTNDYNEGDLCKYRYKARLDTWELNYWADFTPRYTDYFSFSFLVGAKYLDIRDRIYLKFFKDAYTDDFNTKVINRFIGGQLGIDFESNMTSYFSVGCLGKFGAYADLISKKVKLLDNNNETTVFNGYIHRTAPGYTIDILPSIYFRFDPAYIRLGYEYLMIFYSVVSAMQIDNDKLVNHIYRKHHVNMQSAQIGLGFNW